MHTQVVVASVSPHHVHYEVSTCLHPESCIAAKAHDKTNTPLMVSILSWLMLCSFPLQTMVSRIVNCRDLIVRSSTNPEDPHKLSEQVWAGPFLYLRMLLGPPSINRMQSTG